MSAYGNNSRKRTAPLTDTFLNSRGRRSRESWLQLKLSLSRFRVSRFRVSKFPRGLDWKWFHKVKPQLYSTKSYPTPLVSLCSRCAIISWVTICTVSSFWTLSTFVTSVTWLTLGPLCPSITLGPSSTTVSWFSSVACNALLNDTSGLSGPTKVAVVL